MKTGFIAILAILAICAASAYANVGDPFAVSAVQDSPGVWEYTLWNTGTNLEFAYFMDLDWVTGWDEGKTDPEMPFTIITTPATYSVNSTFPWPTWDSQDFNPGNSESLSGFKVQSAQYCRYFRVGYESDNGYTELEGEVTMENSQIPEPGSMIALFSGLISLGGLIRRRA